MWSGLIQNVLGTVGLGSAVGGRRLDALMWLVPPFRKDERIFLSFTRQLSQTLFDFITTHNGTLWSDFVACSLSLSCVSPAVSGPFFCHCDRPRACTTAPSQLAVVIGASPLCPGSHDERKLEAFRGTLVPRSYRVISRTSSASCLKK